MGPTAYDGCGRAGEEKKEEVAERAYRVWTLAGTMIPVVRSGGFVTVDMGEPILDGAWWCNGPPCWV
jgi:hypothetical protein